MVEDQQVEKMKQRLCYSGRLMTVEPGQIISISGKTKSDAKNFDFCLTSDDETNGDSGDIQLHVSINCAGSGEIVRNAFTKKGTGWGEKEGTENLLGKNSSNLIKAGEDFKIAVYIDFDAFFISFNEKPFCSFNHRIPLADIRKIKIFGDVDRVHEVHHSIAMPIEPLSPSKTCFGGSIPAINQGTVIVFKGTPRGSRNGHFLIELLGSCSPEALFQVVVKFEDEGVIAIAQDQRPYREVYASPTPFPFKIDENFKAAVGLTNRSFVFTVNGGYILKIPYFDDCFVGFPASFQVTACDELELEIKRVDIFVMEGSSKKSCEASTNEFSDISRHSQRPA